MVFQRVVQSERAKTVQVQEELTAKIAELTASKDREIESLKAKMNGKEASKTPAGEEE